MDGTEVERSELVEVKEKAGSFSAAVSLTPSLSLSEKSKVKVCVIARVGDGDGEVVVGSVDFSVGGQKEE